MCTIENGASLHHTVLNRIKTGNYKPATLSVLNEVESDISFQLEQRFKRGGNGNIGQRQIK